MVVIAPSGPYKIQKTPPKSLLIRLPSPPAPETVPRWPNTARQGLLGQVRGGGSWCRPNSCLAKFTPPL